MGVPSLLPIVAGEKAVTVKNHAFHRMCITRSMKGSKILCNWQVMRNTYKNVLKQSGMMTYMEWLLLDFFLFKHYIPITSVPRNIKGCCHHPLIDELISFRGVALAHQPVKVESPASNHLNLIMTEAIEWRPWNDGEGYSIQYTGFIPLAT